MSKTEPLRFAEVLPLKRVANLNMPLSHTSIMEMHGLEMHFSGRCPDMVPTKSLLSAGKITTNVG